MAQHNIDLEDWWNVSLQGCTKEDKRWVAALLMYTAWNIWKEPNRRTFDGQLAPPSRVLALIKEEMTMRFRACGRGE
jgi:hypothetical protein